VTAVTPSTDQQLVPGAAAGDAIDGGPTIRARLTGAAPMLAMLLAVLVGTILPVLRNPRFYYWDDTTGVAIGVWQRIAEQVLSGQVPFLQLDMWRGGNLIAEAATGMWNPVMLGLMVGTYPIDDLAVSITVSKIALFLIMAVGFYVMARGYGASPWLAAVGGAVLPLSGWALFMDGTSWINGTAILAFTPWAWWAVRRVFLDRFSARSIVVGLVFSYLLVSVGNPYGVLALAGAFLAVAVEAWLVDRRADIMWLVGFGVSIVLLCIIMYLPFLLTSSVGFRANSGIMNDEFLAPSLSNLLGMSMPTYLPYIKMFSAQYLTFPGMYLAWFVLPILPWLRWRAPGIAWKPLLGVMAPGVAFLLFVLGPTQFLMFRWPARLVPFVFLVILLIVVVVASHGLHRTGRLARIALSVTAILAGAWMAFSDFPRLTFWHLGVTVALFGALALMIRFFDAGPRTFAVLVGVNLAFLGPQLIIAPGNMNVANYNPPTSRAAIQEQFADRAPGLTVQVSDWMNPRDYDLLAPSRFWRYGLPGNFMAVAGIESTTAYSGVGFSVHDAAIHTSYNGSSGAALWDALWEIPRGESAPLADLLGAQTVVVMVPTVPDAEAPEGWREVVRSADGIVFERVAAVSFETSRVTHAGDDLDVSAAGFVGQWGERVTVSSGSGDERTLTFGRLAWPGYTATIDGEPIPVRIGTAGLVQVDLPAGLRNAQLELAFTPPGLSVGLVALGLGPIVALLVGFGYRRRRATL
jgi:hypothetical protein